MHCHCLICCPVNDETIDSIIKSNVVAQIHSALVVLVSCDVDALAIDYEILVPGSILWHYLSASSWHGCHEERHEVAVAIDDIVCQATDSRTCSFGQNNST